MFPSISRATPLDQHTTSFTAQTGMVLEAITSFPIKVNGSSASGLISVPAGAVVEATVVAPPQFLSHTFFYYKINGVKQSFAIATVGNYRIHVKPLEAKKRWFSYFPDKHTFSFRDASGNITPLNPYDLSGAITQPEQHVIMDPNTTSVYFFNQYAVEYTRSYFLGAPIDYVRIPDRDSVIVLTTSGEASEILLNSSTLGLPPFIALRNYSEFAGDLTYITRIPGEDIVTFLRRARSRRVIPPASCITYDGTYLYAGGNGTCWIINPGTRFEIIASFNYDEYTFGIAWLPDLAGALMTTQSQKIMLMDINGNFTEIYQGIALGQPANFNGKIYIPEGEEGWILVYNPSTKAFEAPIRTVNFSPSYTKVYDNKLYVCGNDSERVKVYNTSMVLLEEIVFPDKVTWVSVLDGTIIASHFLKDFNILDENAVYKVIDPAFETRTGPLSHISSNIVSLKTIASNPIPAFTSENAYIWANGFRTQSWRDAGALLLNKDDIVISVAAKEAGAITVSFVLGESAYTYTVTAVAQTYFPRSISIPIGIPPPGGIYITELTLSAKTQPCLVSLEYGVLRVNNEIYTGQALVVAGDVIKVEIPTGHTDQYETSSAPILTIGQRQFAVPITINPGDINPIVYTLNDIDPNKPIEIVVPNMSIPSLYDFIIPNYYDVVVKRNNTVVSGNYYQQFGIGDKIRISFNSSPKRFDERIVYLVGPRNYEFVVKNKLLGVLNYMNFGTLVHPYTRAIDRLVEGTATIIGGTPTYKNITLTPEIQYQTANVIPMGMPTIYSNANVTISGGDSYLVINGNVITNQTANISAATLITGNYAMGIPDTTQQNTLAIARNVITYYDGPVILTQHIEDGDEGFIDIEIGRWKIQHWTVSSENLNPIQPVAVTSFDVPNPDSSEYAMATVTSAWEISRAADRKQFASTEELEYVDTVAWSTNTEEIEETQGRLFAGLTNQIEFAELLVGKVSSPLIEKLTDRKVFVATQDLNLDGYLNARASELELDRNLNDVVGADVYNVLIEKNTLFDVANSNVSKNTSTDRKSFTATQDIAVGNPILTDDNATLEFNVDTYMTDSYNLRFNTSPFINAVSAVTLEFERANDRKDFAPQNQFLKEKDIISYNFSMELDTNKQHVPEDGRDPEKLKNTTFVSYVPVQFDKNIDRKDFSATVEFNRDAKTLQLVGKTGEVKVSFNRPNLIKPNKRPFKEEINQPRYSKSRIGLKEQINQPRFTGQSLKEELNKNPRSLYSSIKANLTNPRFISVNAGRGKISKIRILSGVVSTNQLNTTRILNVNSSKSAFNKAQLIKVISAKIDTNKEHLLSAKQSKSENSVDRILSVRVASFDINKIRVLNFIAPDSTIVNDNLLKAPRIFASFSGVDTFGFGVTGMEVTSDHYSYNKTKENISTPAEYRSDYTPSQKLEKKYSFGSSTSAIPTYQYALVEMESAVGTAHYISIDPSDPTKIVGTDLTSDPYIPNTNRSDFKFDTAQVPEKTILNVKTESGVYVNLGAEQYAVSTMEYLRSDAESVYTEDTEYKILGTDNIQFQTAVYEKIQPFVNVGNLPSVKLDAGASLPIPPALEFKVLGTGTQMTVKDTYDIIQLNDLVSGYLTFDVDTDHSMTGKSAFKTETQGADLSAKYGYVRELSKDYGEVNHQRDYTRELSQEYTAVNNQRLYVREQPDVFGDAEVRNFGLQVLGGDAAITAPKSQPIRVGREVFGQAYTGESDQGIDWYQDISDLYGAFVTLEDAVEAAQKYAEFNPIKIYGTDYWTYRVVLDTGLVCTLPKGRYPVAWLIRGG